MRLFDGFCGAGGCSMGYHRAGFEVVGVDIKPQKNYPFAFILGDALEVLQILLDGGKVLASDGVWYSLDDFDAFAASPPCQEHTSLKALWKREYPDFISETRDLLQRTGKPYAIENVVGAPLKNYVMLCGTMFGLWVIRHRLFETFPSIMFSPMSCNHDHPVVQCGKRPERWKEFASVVGHHSDVEYSGMAMGIDWMTQGELAQAIPPAYTEWIGKQLMNILKVGND